MMAMMNADPNDHHKRKRGALGDLTNSTESSVDGVFKVPRTTDGNAQQQLVSLQRQPTRQNQQQESDQSNTKSLSTIERIDDRVKDDPQECGEIAEEIYDHLRQRELAVRPQWDYMTRQPSLSGEMRAILVDWLVEVAEEYRLSSETLYLTVDYVDRYLSLVEVVKSELQLVGMAAMMLASKYEEIYPPTCDEFVYISDNSYTRDQVFQMETTMLIALNFDLTVVTPKVFLRRFLRATRSLMDTRETLSMVNLTSSYICELSLLSVDFLRFPPSLRALCALIIALDTQKSATLAHYSKYSSTDPELLECLKALHEAYRNASSQSLQAVREKYAHRKCARVSRLTATSEPPTLPQQQ